jgi:hypothetical protein
MGRDTWAEILKLWRTAYETRIFARSDRPRPDSRSVARGGVVEVGLRAGRLSEPRDAVINLRGCGVSIDFDRRATRDHHASDSPTVRTCPEIPFPSGEMPMKALARIAAIALALMLAGMATQQAMGGATYRRRTLTHVLDI